MTQVIKFRPSGDVARGGWMAYPATTANEAENKDLFSENIYDKIDEPIPGNSQGGGVIIDGASSKVTGTLIVKLAKDNGDPDIEQGKQYTPKIRLTLTKETVDSDVETDCTVKVTATLLNAGATVGSGTCAVPDDFAEKTLCLEKKSGSSLALGQFYLQLQGSIDDNSKRRLKCGWALVELHESSSD